ncbi:NUDIX hydrolase [Corynebacterium halotolerans]|uniref:Phosphatase n=1 Tax=Corynebacterium halotolerans YIM 70093 = DSM 44683 TaxID=1121362 RepID=M1MWI2_9CORY|nr:NUDIX domain-containing protein [Corynebacterium halotolerans]AGF72094.1 phosphatase [Corynebacterium halotolerans YIM 70093 = DSM 44683]
MGTLRIAAVVLRDRTGRVLSVRKAGTEAFMLPGGKLEPGETGLQAAVREVAEELGRELDPERLGFLGCFTAPAANEPGFGVECDVFVWSEPLEALPTVREEIAEARWFPADSRDPVLAPLSRDVVFPALERGDDGDRRGPTGHITTV